MIPLTSGIYIIYFLLPFLTNCANSLISIKSFFNHGILVLTVLIICIYYSNTKIFEGYSFKQETGAYLLFCVVLLFVWNVYSLIANSKVSQTLNAVFAAGIAAINLSLSLVISVFPIEKKIFSVDDLKVLSDFGFSGKSFLSLLLSLVLYPFLVTNLVATALTTLKRYWIDKYNEGEDITQEKIDELYHQKYGVYE